MLSTILLEEAEEINKLSELNAQTTEADLKSRLPKVVKTGLLSIVSTLSSHPSLSMAVSTLQCPPSTAKSDKACSAIPRRLSRVSTQEQGFLGSSIALGSVSSPLDVKRPQHHDIPIPLSVSFLPSSSSSFISVLTKRSLHRRAFSEVGIAPCYKLDCHRGAPQTSVSPTVPA